MARRKWLAPVNRFENGSRASIGDSYVEAACSALDRACSREVAMFVPGFTVADVVPMLFRDEDVAKFKAVHGLLSSPREAEHYNLQPYANLTMGIRFADMPAPAKDAFYWQAGRTSALASALQLTREIHMKWGAVKYLLRWFNRNATIGAVRANWPSVLQLCADAPSLKDLQHSPTRYTNPKELSALLPLIRATASTVAAMAMLPGEAGIRPNNGVWISLHGETATYEGTVINLNSQTFFL